MTTNSYCDVLGIPVPSLEDVKGRTDAIPYSLLITALLERGGPMTLEEVAERFEQAGIAPAARALLSLKRCRPARSPVYRDGDEYALDPHDDEVDFWAFRLGLRPPEPRLTLVREADEVQDDAWAEVRASRRRRARHGARLAAMRRVIVHAFPAQSPEAVVLLDVGNRSLVTLTGDELADLHLRLRPFDAIAAVDVRAALRALGIDPGGRRLHELGPPQKTTLLNDRGKKLKITLPLLITGSCRISRPLGDPEALRGYLRRGQSTRLRRRLEADAKSLHALYSYGRLHGAVRLTWGYLDRWLPVPWVHADEPRLYHLKERARRENLQVAAVIGSAPAWKEPWRRVRLFRVVRQPGDTWDSLVGADGRAVDDAEVQAARLVGSREE